MLVAVISDTHRISTYINIAKEYIKSADVLIHLGDNVDDVEELTKGFKGKVYAVKGNCDFSNTYPKENVIILEDKKILLTHGDLYGVKYGLTNLYYRAKELEVDIVLFGHTHEHLLLKEDGIIFMNPGSISLPRSKGRHIGFIELEKGNIKDVIIKEVK